MNRDNFLDRKERLKGEGKVELPLNIDTKKYLIGNISFYDLLVISPIAVISAISIWFFYTFFSLSQGVIIVSLSPLFFMLAFQLIKHPIRKNLSFMQYKLIWKFKFNKRQKQFFYSKGAIDMDNDTQDTRIKLGIKDIFSGCYETVDNRFVKVIEVSAVNMSLMNEGEKRMILDSYKTFINELQFVKSIQISQIAQPINLSQYLLYVDEITNHQESYAKRLLTRGYVKQIESIQKSRNMVSRKRYIIVDQEISSDREKSLQDLDRKATIVKSNIENMLTGFFKLKAKDLQNDELLKLMYTCLDYDNAQALGEFIVTRANNKVNISLGEKTARDIIKTYEQQLKDNIS